MTKTITETHTITVTVTETHTPSFTKTITETYTITKTITETRTPSVTKTITETRTITETWTATKTITETRTPSVTRTITGTYTITQSITETQSPSITGTITETFTITETATQSMTGTQTMTITETRTETMTYTITPTWTDTPYVVPTEIIAVKDCAIKWLHSMQILYSQYPNEYGAWGAQDDSVPAAERASVAITALVLLTFINEGRYDFYPSIPPDPNATPAPTMINDFAVHDPAVKKGIEFILKNVTFIPNSGGDAIISEQGSDLKIYNTASALVALSAYRRLSRSIGEWNSEPVLFRNQIEEAMAGGWRYLLNNQLIEYNNSPTADINNERVYYEPTPCPNNGYDPYNLYTQNDCMYGGWGYPGCSRHFPSWADMSNTQFAVWALEVLDRETVRSRFGSDSFAEPLPTSTVIIYPELTFSDTRRKAAYQFIKNCNEHPEYYPDPLAEATYVAAGGLYGVKGGYGGLNNVGCAIWDAHNSGKPYGSITAAGLWALYCVNEGWASGQWGSNPVAWNEMLWFGQNYTVDYNPNMFYTGGYTNQKWYYYYVMTFMKAMLMNGVPPNHFGTNDWYNDLAYELTNSTGGENHQYSMSEVKPVYGSLCYWKNLVGDPEERDIFCTIAAVLGLETKITSLYRDPRDKIIIALLSPAELLVYDEKNKKTGCESGDVYTEIPMSTYTGCGTEPQVVEIGGAGGLYRIKIKATGNGYVRLKVKSQYQGYDIGEYMTGVTVTAGEEYEYRASVGNVNWPMTLSCDFAKREIPPEKTATMTPSMTGTLTMTITPTMTITATITPTPMMVNVVLKYKSAQVNIIANDPHPWFRLYNSGNNPIDLTKIEIRYWYRYEGSGQAEQVWVDWSGKMPQGTYLTNLTNIGIINGNYGRNQDRYVKITFRQGAGMIGIGEYVEIQTRYNKVDWSNYDQSNDWSFVGYTEYTNWDKVGVYYDGVLIWGEEPGMGALSKEISKVLPAEEIGEGNVYSYPNPSKGEVIIRFSLAKAEEVRVVIYDINGREVWSKEMREGETRSGINNVRWDGRNEQGLEVGNGIYIYSVMTKEKKITKKIALIR